MIFLIEDWAVESPRVKPDRWVSREEASPNQGKTKWSEWSALAFTIRNFSSQLSNWFYAKNYSFSTKSIFYLNVGWVRACGVASTGIWRGNVATSKEPFYASWPQLGGRRPRKLY